MDPFPDLSDGEAVDLTPTPRSRAVWFTRRRWDGYFALLLALALPVVLITVGRGALRAAAIIPVLLVMWGIVRSTWPAEGRAVPTVSDEPGGWAYIAFLFVWLLVGLLCLAAIKNVAPLLILGFFGVWSMIMLLITKLARGRITRGH